MLGLCLLPVRDNKDEHLNPEDKNVEDGSFDYRYAPTRHADPATTSPHQPRSPAITDLTALPLRSPPGPRSLPGCFSHLPPPASFSPQVLCRRDRLLPEAPGQSASREPAARCPPAPSLSLAASAQAESWDFGTWDTALSKCRSTLVAPPQHTEKKQKQK